MSNFSVRVLADSKSLTGDRLTTIEATYPRVIHSEIMTHKMLSKSSASSRAIPIETMLKRVSTSPFVPHWWGSNQPGMQAYAEVEDKAGAEAWWRRGIDKIVAHAAEGNELGLHKQIVNRFVETGMWITVIISGTTWTNFEGLRTHEAAEPHFQKLAVMIRDAMGASTPKFLQEGEWHLPLIYDEDRARACELESDPLKATELLVKASVGRCARVSYLTHDGKRDLLEDVKLHDRMMVQTPLHASPAEHVAQAMNWPLWYRRSNPLALKSHVANHIRMQMRDELEPDAPEIPLVLMELEAALAQISSGNFRGFKQYRKTFKNEHIGERMP